MTGEPMEFFLNVVMRHNADECLPWPFGRDRKGYAKIDWEGEGRFVSRIVCELVHGQAPSAIHQAAHSCGKGHEGCVAKMHLSWKTPAGNAADKIVHGTIPMGETHGMAKLTADDVRQIRALKGTASTSEIGRRFGVSSGAISSIYRGLSWAWLPSGAEVMDVAE